MDDYSGAIFVEIDVIGRRLGTRNVFSLGKYVNHTTATAQTKTNVGIHALINRPKPSLLSKPLRIENLIRRVIAHFARRQFSIPSHTENIVKPMPDGPLININKRHLDTFPIEIDVESLCVGRHVGEFTEFSELSLVHSEILARVLHESVPRYSNLNRDIGRCRRIHHSRHAVDGVTLVRDVKRTRVLNCATRTRIGLR